METIDETIIHLEWDGPQSLDDVKKLDEKEDYGKYQIYGNHPVYGENTLIYIGMAAKQTFGKRMVQEEISWLNDKDIQPINIFVGRFDMDDKLLDQEWEKLTEKVEQMLIYAHAPSYNSSKIDKPLGKEFEKIHILNWGIRGSLLPEVSGARWSNYYC
jgi:hypothetical protein